jgi:hypothetical protein
MASLSRPLLSLTTASYTCLRAFSTAPLAALFARLPCRALSTASASPPPPRPGRRRPRSPSAPLTLPPRSLTITQLADNPGAVTRKRRKGRGVGSGHGLARSAGLGTRGQRSHGGGLAVTFEGGQSPLWRRTPKFGVMPKRFRRELEPLNLDRLQLWIDTGRLDPGKCVSLPPRRPQLCTPTP